MAARKRTITKLTLAFAVACLLTITPQPILSQDADQLYQQGVAVYKRRDFLEAESIFSQVTKIDPNNADAHVYLGLALKNQGKLEEAIASYEKAIELDPNYAKAYYNLGIALSNQGKLEGAIASYEKAIELDPNYAKAYYNLGIALSNQGKLEGAIASYEKAIELDPNYAKAYNNLGIAQYDQGKLEGAIASYEKAIELDPNYAKAYYNLGNALYKQGKLEDAIFSYEQAIEIDPNYTDAYYSLGNALYKQGKLEDAISSYEQAIELDPNYAVAYKGLGNALYNLGELEAAISSYEQAIEIDPNYAIAYNNLGIAQSDQGELEAAIASYEQALSLPNQKSSSLSAHTAAYNNLGYVFQEQGKLEEAVKQYQRSLEIDPEYILAQNNLREAERLLAIKLNPPLPDIDDTKHLPSVEDEPLVIVLRSTARIVAQVPAEGTSIGAGWVVKKEGNKVWIVTNRHVISDRKTKIPSKKIEVEFFSELPDTERPRYDATIINSTESNDDLDLAVLEVTGIPDDIQPLVMRFGRVRLDEDVRIIGHPYTIEDPWSASRGEVLNYNPNNPKFFMNGFFAQGSSGAPVVDSDNQVIGMMVNIRTAIDTVASSDQQALNNFGSQPATGGVGLAFRIDVVVDQLRKWKIID